MPDNYASHASGLNSPGIKHYVVTPNDSTDFAVNFRSVWIGGAGNVVIVTDDGVAVTYQGAAAGSTIPMRGKRINATGTTATNMVGMY